MNPSTVIVGAIVLLIFLWIIIREIKNKKNGKGGCSCGCGGCSMSDVCHPKKEK